MPRHMLARIGACLPMPRGLEYTPCASVPASMVGIRTGVATLRILAADAATCCRASTVIWIWLRAASSAHLAQLRVFLPLAAADKATNEPQLIAENAPVLTQAQALTRAIEEQVLAILRKADDSTDDTWRERVASSLQHLAAELIPKSLADIVRQEFPAPMAIAFRRFDLARHNPYEQLDRMINLVEACTYFVFHVLLADYSRARKPPMLHQTLYCR